MIPGHWSKSFADGHPPSILLIPSSGGNSSNQKWSAPLEDRILQFDLGRGQPTTSIFGFGLGFFLAACFLPLLFGSHRKRFVDFGGGGVRELLFQVRNPLIGGVQFLLQRFDQRDQPIRIDPTLPHVFLELLDGIHD